MGDRPTPHRAYAVSVDADRLEPIRMCLDDAAGLPAAEALAHLREAADLLTDLIDESMAAAVLSGQASIRAAGLRAGLTENAVGPRLARTHTLGAYADERGRVTAAAVERAKYDHETGTPREAPGELPAMRFKPRRTP